MSVRCPYCQFSIELRGAHPGRFTPKCPQCHHRFMLVIPEDASIPPLVGEMPAGQTAHETVAGGAHPTRAKPTVVPAKPAVAKPAAVAATMPPPSSSAPGGAGATLPPHAHNTMSPASASNRSFVDGVTVAPPSAKEPVPKTGIGLEGSPGDLPRENTYAKETVYDPTPSLTGTLGGYELMEKLGEGGMGAVYRARQISLDRDVALKVLSPQLAADPQFVARFTREAYAAAQLSHHNVVQIHDIGIDKNTNFFSMEYVPGQTLDRLVKHDGKLDPQVAVGYVLQAARGLRFAHDHGLIHRDVKPDNLLLNEQGIVKVADLGLVKQAGKTEVNGGITAAQVKAANVAAQAEKPDATQLNISMGTPAYMPPEQARDAAHVDQRADVYSLGCTLYDLLTGRPPFNGKTAIEVITKHQTEPIVPPDRVARHVSPELSQVVMKMMAKKREERYQSMAEVVEALESILGVDSGKTFSPKEEHVRVLEGAVAQYNGSKWANLRKNLTLTFYGVCLAGAVICAVPKVGKPFVAGAFVGFAVLTTVFYQLLIGMTQKTHVFTRVRQYVMGARLVDWLKFVAVFAVVILLLVAFNLHWPWLAAAVVALGAAAVFHFTVDKLVAAERKTPLGHVEGMLKKMRLRGLDETALRQFVCKYSGERWEEMYEAVFGYEAKRAARRSWGKSERGRDRKKFAAWRDFIIDWVERRSVWRREERERRLLQRIESKALAAAGMDLAIANRKAKDAAARMVDKAARVKESADRRAMMTALPTSSSGKTLQFSGAKPLASWADGFEEADDDGSGRRRGRDGERVHESYFKRRFGTPLDMIFGAYPRVIIAAALLCLFGLWMRQNTGVKVAEEQLAQRTDATDIMKKGEIKIAEIQRNWEAKPAEKLRVTFLPIPDKIEDAAGSYNGGAAGALLLLSAFFNGRILAITSLLSAAFILFGDTLPIPFIVGSPWMATIAGLVLGLVGIMMFRKTAADG